MRGSCDCRSLSFVTGSKCFEPRHSGDCRSFGELSLSRVWSTISFLVGPQESLLATVKRRSPGMSHATTASPEPSFRAPWRVGDAVVGRGNAGWTTSKSGHICPCQNCSQGPSAEKTGRGSLLNRLSCPPDDPIDQGTELN